MGYKCITSLTAIFGIFCELVSFIRMYIKMPFPFHSSRSLSNAAEECQ